jgi:hypothetical protein
LVTIKSASLSLQEYGVRDWVVTLGTPNLEVRTFLKDHRKYGLLLRGDMTLFTASQYAFARALVDGRYADAAKRMVEMLVLAKKHSLLAKECDIGGVLLGKLHDNALPQPYFFSMEASGERHGPGGQGRGTEAGGVLVATPKGGDTPVMVVLELKRAKGAAPTPHEVDGTVNQVYNKKYLENGVDAVSGFCKAAAEGQRPPYCPADDQPLSGTRVGVAIVVVVPPVGAVGEDLMDTHSSVPSQHEIMDGGTHVGTATITSSGCAVDADRHVAVLWKTFASDYAPAKVAK